jgi:hypothetical protein
MHPNELHFAYTRVRLWQTVEPQSMMTTGNEVVQSAIIKPKSTSAQNIFLKTNAPAGSTLRTRNQKKRYE